MFAMRQQTHVDWWVRFKCTFKNCVISLSIIQYQSRYSNINYSIWCWGRSCQKSGDVHTVIPYLLTASAQQQYIALKAFTGTLNTWMAPQAHIHLLIDRFQCFPVHMALSRRTFELWPQCTDKLIDMFALELKSADLFLS